MWILKFKAQPTKCVFACGTRLSTTAKCAVIKSFEHSADNETVLGSSRKQGGAAEHLTGDSEKRNCRSRL